MRRTSRRKQDLSIWLQAFSRSMVKSHRPFVTVAFLEPSSDGVDDGLATVCGSEPQPRWVEVSCPVLKNGSQQGFCF